MNPSYGMGRSHSNSKSVEHGMIFYAQVLQYRCAQCPMALSVLTIIAMLLILGP